MIYRPQERGRINDCVSDGTKSVTEKGKKMSERISRFFRKNLFYFFNGFFLFFFSEVIFTVLDTIVTKKIEFNDMYNREGYIINNGPYYIFNSSDIDINSSLYSKIMDFSTFKNKYTFDEFSNKIFQDTTKTKKQIEEQPKVQLSEQDISYNNQIINNNTIYGSYVSKTGIFDGLFRIIDKSTETKSTDKRKIPSGMAITSYKKNKLEALIEKLNINVQSYTRMETSTSDLNNTILQNIVEKYFLDKKIMLKPHKKV